MVAITDRAPRNTRSRRAAAKASATSASEGAAGPRILDVNALSPEAASAVATLVCQHRQERSIILGAIQAFSQVPHTTYYGVQLADAGNLWGFAQRLAETAHELDPNFRAPHFATSIQAIEDANTAAKVGEQLGQAFSKSTTRTLVLDEIDRLWEGQDAIDTHSGPVDIAGLANSLLIALVRALPADFRFFICTRSLDYAPWQDLIADGLARPAFTPPGPLVPRLDVYAFGTGIVYADSKRVAYWDGLLPQSIFFFFMDKPLLTREEIFQAFWPEMTARDATNVFHVIKRKIAERVNYDPIVYGMGRYHRSPDISIYYDVAEFEACVNRFYENPDDIQSMERAVSLRRAPFMHGYKQPWAVERRRQLDAMYVDALIGLGSSYGNSDPTRALVYFQRAAYLAPTREDISRQVIQRHAELGQIDAANAQYQVLEKSLQTAFGITPDRATRELYQKINTRSNGR